MPKQCKLLLCMICFMLAASPGIAHGANGNYYGIRYDGYIEIPYRATLDGGVAGFIPRSRIVKMIEKYDSNWAKVLYDNKEVYVWGDRLRAYDEPTLIASDWARDAVAYYDRTNLWQSVFGHDFTKTITRKQAAYLIFDKVCAMARVANEKWLPGAISDSDIPDFTDMDMDLIIDRVVYWGIMSGDANNRFNPSAELTGEQVTALLKKTENYLTNVAYEGNSPTLPVGSARNPQAPCSIEEAIILIDQLRSEDEKATLYEQGVFTIDGYLGSHLSINSEGNAELDSKSTQAFRLTYNKTWMNAWGNFENLYNLQTMDGKYLGVKGTAKNGSRIVAQDQEYLWVLHTGPSKEYKNTVIFLVPGDSRQSMNLCEWKTADGTPIITWLDDVYKETDTFYDNNALFVLNKVK